MMENQNKISLNEFLYEIKVVTEEFRNSFDGHDNRTIEGWMKAYVDHFGVDIHKNFSLVLICSKSGKDTVSLMDFIKGWFR